MTREEIAEGMRQQGQRAREIIAQALKDHPGKALCVRTQGMPRRTPPWLRPEHNTSSRRA